MTTSLSRRDFLKQSGWLGAGLILGFRLDVAAADGLQIENMAQVTGSFEPNAYIRIDTDGIVTLQAHRSEMGQGISTAVTMILAEELATDWSMIRIEHAPADRVYGNQMTGGSQSISSSYQTLRLAGAATRMMLVVAAAQTWGVDVADCYAENGVVFQQATGEKLTYAELVPTAATLEPPRRDIALKNPEDFRIIGTRKGNWDNADFVTGAAVFASDIQLPDMLVAVIARSPLVGGKVADYASSATESIPGVRFVLNLDPRLGIAVVADNTWAALAGRDVLEIEWEGGNPDLNTAEIRQQLVDGFELANDPNTLEAIYEIPYFAHATMEPMVCVADVREDSCQVWAPTQDRQGALTIARTTAQLPREAVTIHVPLIGGGFGRRIQNDYVKEAVMISQAVGKPVKVFWTREDDMQNDFYQASSVRYLRAKLDNPTRIPARSSAVSGLRTGAWRSVGEHPVAFVHECFVDEIAAALERDPLDFQLELHAGSPRQAVLEMAAEKAGWGNSLPEGWGRGIAVHSTFGVTHVAQVADVSVDDRGRIRVHRVVCAVDCGFVVNPDGVEAQMESGIVFGLSAALHKEITVENGQIQQSNFNNYPVLRLSEMPAIEVYIVQNDRQPTGIGEMGVPPIAPAVANAVYAATGKRLRRLPFRPEDLL